MRRYKKEQIVWIRWGICFLLSLSFFFGPWTKQVQAASASITLETTNTTIHVGDTVTVRLMIQGTERLGGFETFLTYNESILEFIPGDGPIAGGDGVLRISDLDPDVRAKQRTYEMNFTALGVGGCEFAIRGRAYAYTDEGEDEMSVSSNTLSVKIDAAATAGDNTRLATLKISPGTLSPAFSPEITEYHASVGADIPSLVISAIPEEESAKVTVSGNQNFAEGENVVEIAVTAENADTAVYRIVVQREKTQTGENNSADGTDDLSEDSFIVKEKKGGFTFSGTYSYHVVQAPSEALKRLPEGYESYTLVLYGKKVPAFRKTDSTIEEAGADPRVVLLYVDGWVNGKEVADSDQVAGFYEFDTLTHSMVKKEVQTIETEREVFLEIEGNTSWYLYSIIVVLMVICALLGIALIRAGKRGKNRRKQKSR